MLHGLVLLNKPKNITSHKVVARVKNLLRVKKAGHFGTLDPMAEGVLLLGLGHATKFFDFYLKKKKLYSGLVKFGCATTTYDAEGDPMTEQKEIDLNQIDLPALLDRFTGKQMQTPPIYSAKKFKGKALYKYARENKENEVEIKPAEVEVFSLNAHIVEPDTLAFETLTSSGTYIRSLAHDMGVETGVGAHLSKLTRDGVGEFHIKDSLTIGEIEDHVENGELDKVVTPIEVLLPEFSKVIAGPAGRRGILNGMTLLEGDIREIIPSDNKENYKVLDEAGTLLAIARKDPFLKRFSPYIVFPQS
ncbi:MAG: tRNA pseudouridine(55) synthase TruB [bacterium]|nr:tRNA pseudouridine(55) synthase TruB [bacterium]